MTLDEFKSHWLKRRDDFAQYRAQVDAAALIDHLLADVEEMAADRTAMRLMRSRASATCACGADRPVPNVSEPLRGASVDGMLNAANAAKYLGLAPQTLAKMRLSGDSPPFYKLGRRVLYKRGELDLWVASRRRRSTSDPGDV